MGRAGWPSKTGNPSGKGRDNNPPRWAYDDEFNDSDCDEEAVTSNYIVSHNCFYCDDTLFIGEAPCPHCRPELAKQYGEDQERLSQQKMDEWNKLQQLKDRQKKEKEAAKPCKSCTGKGFHIMRRHVGGASIPLNVTCQTCNGTGKNIEALSDAEDVTCTFCNASGKETNGDDILPAARIQSYHSPCPYCCGTGKRSKHAWDNRPFGRGL